MTEEKKKRSFGNKEIDNSVAPNANVSGDSGNRTSGGKHSVSTGHNLFLIIPPIGTNRSLPFVPRAYHNNPAHICAAPNSPVKETSSGVTFSYANTDSCLRCKDNLASHGPIYPPDSDPDEREKLKKDWRDSPDFKLFEANGRNEKIIALAIPLNGFAKYVGPAKVGANGKNPPMEGKEHVAFIAEMYDTFMSMQLDYPEHFRSSLEAHLNAGGSFGNFNFPAIEKDITDSDGRDSKILGGVTIFNHPMKGYYGVKGGSNIHKAIREHRENGDGSNFFDFAEISDNPADKMNQSNVFNGCTMSAEFVLDIIKTQSNPNDYKTIEYSCKILPVRKQLVSLDDSSEKVYIGAFLQGDLVDFILDNDDKFNVQNVHTPPSSAEMKAIVRGFKSRRVDASVKPDGSPDCYSEYDIMNNDECEDCKFQNLCAKAKALKKKGKNITRDDDNDGDDEENSVTNNKTQEHPGKKTSRPPVDDDDDDINDDTDDDSVLNPVANNKSNKGSAVKTSETQKNTVDDDDDDDETGSFDEETGSFSDEFDN